MSLSTHAFGADLAIIDVEPADRKKVVVGAGDKVNLRITVRNNDRRTAVFSVAQIVEVRPGRLGNVGRSETIAGRETKEVIFQILIAQNRIADPFSSAAEYSDILFLVDPTGGGTLFGLHEDEDPDDNWTTVSFPAVRLRNLTVTLESVDVQDNMDTASFGDWYVFLSARPGNRRDRLTSDVWPGLSSARNVSDPETLRIDRSIRLERVRENESLHITVMAMDCDGDFPIPTVYVDRIGSGGAGPGPEDVSCRGEEEAWEFSGANDFHFETVELTPGQWLRGGNFSSGRPEVDVGFVAHVNVTVDE